MQRLNATITLICLIDDSQIFFIRGIGRGRFFLGRGGDTGSIFFMAQKK